MSEATLIFRRNERKDETAGEWEGPEPDWGYETDRYGSEASVFFHCGPPGRSTAEYSQWAAEFLQSNARVIERCVAAGWSPSLVFTWPASAVEPGQSTELVPAEAVRILGHWGVSLGLYID